MLAEKTTAHFIYLLHFMHVGWLCIWKTAWLWHGMCACCVLVCVCVSVYLYVCVCVSVHLYVCVCVSVCLQLRLLSCNLLWIECLFKNSEVKGKWQHLLLYCFQMCLLSLFSHAHTPTLSKMPWRLYTRLRILLIIWKNSLCAGHCGLNQFLHSLVFDSHPRIFTHQVFQRISLRPSPEIFLLLLVLAITEGVQCEQCQTLMYMNLHVIVQNDVVKLFLQVLV